MSSTSATTSSNSEHTKKKNSNNNPPVPETTNDLGQSNKWTRMPLRMRPHRNPLSSNEDDHPDSPDQWVEEIVVEENLYPNTSTKANVPPAALAAFPGGQANPRGVEFLDIGCAFGGMLIALAPHFPNTMMLGMEIRSKVVDYAQNKTRALRSGELILEDQGDVAKTHHYNNVWFTQANVMKFVESFFERGQLKKIFIAHPDPHWKKNNARRRIVTPGLVQRYANLLAIGGFLYTVSDVPELEQWMIQCLDESPQFERVPEEELESEKWFLEIVTSSSEDAKRAVRKNLSKNYAVHRRIAYDDKKLAPLF